ncbi:hypothetical protein [Trujillonella endophytica]|uniref:Uncharacterized protein n=1 Tax=Trujillonella endophytica TaxID=673521 RepID=A0A1H8VAG0_9ACTN|nr:hypothetical protein [Trujillella endophytica]SEP11798.1 hypothetical protein SAMN05660991_03343 [Trujillella endophytica]
MGLLDRLLGRRRHDDRRDARYDAGYDGYDSRDDDRYAGGHQGEADTGYGQQPRQAPRGRGPLTDAQAVERYRYLLRTAPPDQIEEAHAEAFAQLTPQQRQEVLVQLAAAVPSGERPRTDDPRTLARAATRAEIRQPGTLERVFGPGPGGYGGGYGSGYGPGYGGGPGRGYGGGFGMGGMGAGIGATMLGTIGGLVVGSAVADALFDTGLGDGGLFGGGDEEAYAEGYQDGAGADDGGGYDGTGSDGGGYDGTGSDGGGDVAGDYGGGGDDFGGGFDGGGDFGGDFGGGDF